MRKCIGSSRRISLRSKEKTEDGWAKLGTTALEKAELGAFQNKKGQSYGGSKGLSIESLAGLLYLECCNPFYTSISHKLGKAPVYSPGDLYLSPLSYSTQSLCCPLFLPPPQHKRNSSFQRATSQSLLSRSCHVLREAKSPDSYTLCPLVILSDKKSSGSLYPRACFCQAFCFNSQSYRSSLSGYGNEKLAPNICGS